MRQGRKEKVVGEESTAGRKKDVERRKKRNEKPRTQE